MPSTLDHSEYQIGENLGPYRILGVLGAGGMGTVYAAWDSRLDRRVAIKRIHPHLLANAASEERFLREAKAAARITHPNVVRVYRIDTVGEGPVIEMECVDGRPLSALMQTGPMSAPLVIHLTGQILAALTACHEQGIIHRDLKPGNLLVTSDQQVYLADFGIARALESSNPDGTAEQTRTGLAWGTPRYMPPEAWDELKPNARWDLYAVGVLVYEALAGRPAFTGQTAAGLMKQILTSTPPSIGTLRPELSSELVDLVTDLMSRDPERRPASAQEALARLARVPEHSAADAETQPMERVPAGASRQPPEGGVRHRPGLMLLALAAVALLAAAGYYLSNRIREPAATAAEPGTGPALTPGRPEPMELTPTAVGAIFAYDDGVHGQELWHMSPEGTARMIIDLVPGVQGSNPRRLYAAPGLSAVIFAATTPELGDELWIARPGMGYDIGVDLVRDIIPGPMGSEPHVFGDLSGYFALYATSLREGREPWLSNGHPQQTAAMGDLYPGVAGSAMMTPKALVRPEEIYFLGLHDGGLGQVLFHYDHQAHEVQLLGDVFEDAGSMAVAGDTLIIGNRSPEYGVEPWCYRSGTEGLQLLADLNPGSQSSDPDQFIDWNGHAFFRANLPDTGNEPWISDGTAAGTRLLADINPGPEGSDAFGFVGDAHGLFFKATTAAHGQELWVTDGTESGTRMVADVNPGPQGSGPYNLLPAGDRLYFTANDGVHGEELFVYYNETGEVERLTDRWPGPVGSEPYDGCYLAPSGAMFKVKTPDLGPAILRLEWSAGSLNIATHPLPYRVTNVP